MFQSQRMAGIAIRLVILCSTLLFIVTIAAEGQQYDSFCNPTKSDKLNVHIISHTHLDAGWVRTYDEYYKQSVYEIMKTVTESLVNKEGMKSRKFTFVEMSFFSRYWNDISRKEQQVIRDLVTTGKIHFTSGGWVMNDEAAPHYSMIIDQMSYGHRWINMTFGPQYLPTTGWQIDPFGHSREYASIISQMGFNALFLGRIDFQDKEKRMSDRNMEFIWKTDPNLKLNNYIFTGVTPSGYYPSEGVCLNCYHETNAENLLKQLKKQIAGYRTNHIMSTMGGDFNFVNAEYDFRSLDQLIEYVNANQNEVYLVYSTPDCYVKSLYNSGLNWTHVESNDFFPYADFFNDYWSGYFTSRPAFKYLMVYGNSILQILKQLVVKADIYAESQVMVNDLQEVLGIGLHHDAITGTSKQYVSDDYVHMISKAIQSADQIFKFAYQKMYGTTAEPYICHGLNISQCNVLEKSHGDPVEIAIYNPLAHRVSHQMRLPIVRSDGQITDSNGSIVESQVIPIPNFIQSLPERKSSAANELVFEAVLEPFSFTKYFLQYTSPYRQYQMQLSRSYKSPIDLVIQNHKISVVIDGSTGLLKYIIKDKQLIGLRQNFGYYTRGWGKNSGAYAMHTRGSVPELIAKTGIISVIRGSVCQEVIQEFKPYLKQIIRLCKNSDFIEFDWTVGPLPTDKDFELITKFESGFRNNGTFYTDSNGIQTMERKRGKRPNWTLSTTEEVASNYYPVNSWIYIKDIETDLQMSLIPDRAQGGSSIEDGSLELMIHRRLHFDDGYGMEEKLDEPGTDGKGLVVRGKHYLLIDRIGQSMQKVKAMNKQMYTKPLALFVTNSPRTSTSQIGRTNIKGIGVSGQIDPSIHLLTLEELSPNTLFVRFEYFGERKSNESLSFKLSEFFTGVSIISAVETSLTGTERLSDMMSRKYKWICNECNNVWVKPSDGNIDIKITLTPNQIRSFIMVIERPRDLSK